eukprot:PhF_6_TR40416/c0_g1_i1/m.60243/K21768/TBCE; tubulin-specific chaperone E
MSETEPTHFTLDSRVCDEDGFLGIVRYIGPLDGTEGEFVGVEWDDASRGKHDGMFKSKRYFTCSNPSSKASFVLSRKLLGGISFPDAIITRFSFGVGDVSKYKCQGTAPFIKADNGSYPYLTNCACGGVPSLRRIATAGPPGAVRFLFPNIVDLSLAETMLMSWTEVFSLCEQLEKLSYLNVASNPLGDMPITESAFPQLKVVKATDTQMTGLSLPTLLNVFPNLQELSICHNVIGKIPDLNVNHPVQIIRLNFASIDYWGNLNALGSLKHLVSLHVSDNPIHKVEISHGEFNTLQHLYLRNTSLQTFHSLDVLNHLPALKDIAVTNVPVLTELKDLTDMERRYVVIAHVERVNCVNAGAVTPEEREAAERFVVRHFSESPEQLLCYERLRKRHGDLKPFVEISLAPEVDMTVSLKVAQCKKGTAPAFHAVESLPVVFETPFRIDTRWTAVEVLQEIAQITGMEITKKMTLYLWDQELSMIPGARTQLFHVKHVKGATKLWQMKIHKDDTLYLVCNV